MTTAANLKPDSDPPRSAGETRGLYDPDLVRTATLLVVDDEAVVTNSLRHFFRIEMGIENVVPFNISSEAMRYAEQHRVDLVITDFVMPGADGLALLEIVKRRHPEATRILLTGHADKTSAIRAINEVGLFQYIEKPWDTDRLTTVVRAGLEHMALQRTLRELIDRLDMEHSSRERMRRALLRALA